MNPLVSNAELLLLLRLLVLLKGTCCVINIRILLLNHGIRLVYAGFPIEVFLLLIGGRWVLDQFLVVLALVLALLIKFVL